MRRRDLLNLGLGTAALGLAELTRQQVAGPPWGPERWHHGVPPSLHPWGRSAAGPAGWQCPVARYRQVSSEAARQRLLAQYWQDNCHLASSVLMKGQTPWARIIIWADSRVPPGWIFDVNPGQLFVVRSAGNTAFDDGVASME